MVIQSDYPSNGYPYGTAYQCGGNPYVSALGHAGYPTSLSGAYSPTTVSCYGMPPPQHIPQHDKNGSKDG